MALTFDTSTGAMGGNTDPNKVSIPSGTLPSLTPTDRFNLIMLDALRKVQASGNNPALLLQQQKLQNQALNLSNPMSDTPYKSYFQGMGYGAPGAEASTQDAFAPGQLSLENQAKYNAQGAANATDFIGKTMAAFAPQLGQAGQVPFYPGGQQGNILGTGNNGNGTLADIGGIKQQEQQGADLQTQTDAFNRTHALIQNFNDMVKKNPTFNQSPLIMGNALTQWLNTGVISDPATQGILATLQEIATTIGPVLGSPGSPTDAKLVIQNELIPRLMSGKDISTVLQTIEDNAQAKLHAGYVTAHSKPFTQSSSTPNTAPAGFAWNPTAPSPKTTSTPPVQATNTIPKYVAAPPVAPAPKQSSLKAYQSGGLFDPNQQFSFLPKF